MPFINVKTNAAVGADKETAIKAALGQAVTAIPGKTEAWLMVGIEPEYTLYFGGTNAPAAMVEVSLYGKASDNSLGTLTSHITGIMYDVLGIPSDRVYVSYSCTYDWGWDGSNF